MNPSHQRWCGEHQDVCSSCWVYYWIASAVVAVEAAAKLFSYRRPSFRVLVRSRRLLLLVLVLLLRLGRLPLSFSFRPVSETKLCGDRRLLWQTVLVVHKIYRLC